MYSRLRNVRIYDSLVGLPLSHRKKICIKSEKFLSKVSGCEWQTINSTQNEKYYNKSLLRHHRAMAI